ncbi:MAG TPA: class I SAM-dependent methyltransferase [Longimicrobiaceae bacterium]|nr:class I SAM-dependent methyltransferase [Longimicrobiaceae bacterium]
MSFKDHFSGHATAYARHRPDYPADLFAWLAAAAPGRGRAWDCATGNGQAAVALAEHFREVAATDASEKQVHHAFAHPRVAYRVAPAEASGVDAGSVDLVTVAQALHWFDIPAFYAEVERVLRPAGVLAVWAYGLFASTPEIDELVIRFYRDVVGPYWPPDRKMIEDGYRDVELPFAPIEAPDFFMAKEWTAEDLRGYLHTWSATQGYIAARGGDPIDGEWAELAEAWGPERRTVRWPLILKVGRKAE